MCKIMERMITVRLRWHLEKHKSRAKKDYAPSFAYRTVSKALANQRSVLAVFLDNEKAYVQYILLLKLLKLRVTGYMFNSINFFLKSRSFQVRVQSALLSVRYLENGIPQG